MVKNLFKRMGYVRRLAVTGKVEVLGKLKAEIETVYLYGVVNKNQWTQNSIIYEYQPRPNPSNFIPGFNKTLAEKGSESVPIASSTDKRMIATKFSITLTR